MMSRGCCTSMHGVREREDRGREWGKMKARDCIERLCSVVV